MKIALVFLLVAVSCYFDTAKANCMSRCAVSCGQVHMTDLYCLQRSLIKDLPATISALANFLCAYDRCKSMKNKTELIRAINDLKSVTQCTLENILGNDFTVEELSADVDRILQYLLRAVVDILSGLNIGMLTTPVCGPLKPLLTKVAQILYIFGVPRLDGRIQALTGINGHKTILTAVANSSPSLLNGLLELLLGQKLEVSDIAGILNGVTAGLVVPVGVLSGGLGGLTSSLSGATDMIGKTVGGLSGGPEGVTGILNGPTRGLVGVLPRVLGGLTDSLGGVTNVVSKTAGGLTSGLGGVTGILNGLPEGLVGVLPGGLGGLTSSLSGATDMIGKTVGGLSGGPEGVTGILNGPTRGLVGVLPGVLGGVTGSLGGVTEVVSKTVEGLTSGLGGVTGILSGSPEGLVRGLLGGLGGVTSSLGGVTDMSGQTVGGLTSGQTSGLGDVTGLLGGVTNRKGGATVGLTSELEVATENNGNTLGGELMGGATEVFNGRPGVGLGSNMFSKGMIGGSTIENRGLAAVQSPDGIGGLLQGGGLLETVGNIVGVLGVPGKKSILLPGLIKK